MRLWLDDERPMPDGFDLHVRTVQQAIDVIVGGGVTHISFDNDLGEDEEGRHLANFIELGAFNGRLRRMTWEIHSGNPVGRDAIRAAMKSAERFWTQE